MSRHDDALHRGGVLPRGHERSVNRPTDQARRPPGTTRSAVGAELCSMTTTLEREMYTEAAAARLLRVAPATLHYWLEGRSRGPKTYKPIIREEATGPTGSPGPSSSRPACSASTAGPTTCPWSSCATSSSRCANAWGSATRSLMLGPSWPTTSWSSRPSATLTSTLTSPSLPRSAASTSSRPLPRSSTSASPGRAT